MIKNGISIIKYNILEGVIFVGFLNVLETKYNIKLNEQQQQAVTHVNGPAVVLAGPGSGKTTVITARAAYLILEAGINPESILTLTFNRAAKFEMEHRFNKLFASAIDCHVHFSTLHSFCNLVVRDYERKQGKRLKRIEGDDETDTSKRRIIKNIYQQVNGSNINDDELENLVNEIGLVKNKMIKDLEAYSSGIKNFALIYKTFEEYKRSNLYIDFDDMLTYAYSILNKCPDILKHYRDKYRYIQIDEGQDLSKVQFEVLKLLVNPKDNNLFIVADDDQSIYGFRGAEPQYIFDIERELDHCKIFRLENNYRSSKNIVEMSSHFIKQNKKRYDKNHNTENEYKEDPCIIGARDEYDQVKVVLEKIKTYHKEGKQVAILYRNNLSSIMLIDVFDRKGIPYKLKQNKLFFFKHWVVQDILAFFRLALNPGDFNSFARIYFKMNRYISKTMLEYAMSVDNKNSIIDGILSFGDLKPYQQRTMIELKKEFNQLGRTDPSLALDYIEDEFRYFDSVKEYCENTGLSFDYLYGLFGILRTIAAGCRTVPGFLQRIEELEALFEAPKDLKTKNMITLTTMHSSKGLEYDVVLMVDLTNNEIPGWEAGDQPQKSQDESLLEEERRLFYVGMTRAKEHLYMISPEIKNGIIGVRSVFIDEVAKCMNLKVLREIGEGVIVNHKHFGVGVVAALLENRNDRIILEIDFKGVRRKLDLLTCIENGLLSY